MTRPRWKDEAEKNGVRVEAIVRPRAKRDVIQGEESELHEILINLVYNALDAMPDGGRITLSTENVRDRVVVSVSDTGKGMTPQDRDRAFEPFFTTKGSRGSGLGLSMVYAIVKRYGGEIILDSAPGAGTSVRLSFRAVERPSEEEGAPEAEASVSRRILLIDDEADFVDIFTKILQSEGHHVENATDPREGLARVEAERFDLVSTDLSMPEMTGWEVAQNVKKINPDIQVVLVTGWGAEFDEDETARRGVDWVLQKPIRKDDFLRVVAECGDRPDGEGGSR
ncbi:MAG: ATP-binding protein [Nitrospinota bacterium]|jgi:CheY-like chemotaxis protein|nr:ATP-binding protein [Nitrospinota bacterium]HJM43305.1 ATP-binding protein [Nitrospinota bacterium]